MCQRQHPNFMSTYHGLMPVKHSVLNMKVNPHLKLCRQVPGGLQHRQEVAGGPGARLHGPHHAPGREARTPRRLLLGPLLRLQVWVLMITLHSEKVPTSAFCLLLIKSTY